MTLCLAVYVFSVVTHMNCYAAGKIIVLILVVVVFATCECLTASSVFVFSVARQDLLELAVHSGLDVPQKRPLNPRGQLEPQEPRIRRRVGRILREVKAECGDSNASSDDDGGEWSPPSNLCLSPTGEIKSIMLKVGLKMTCS